MNLTPIFLLIFSIGLLAAAILLIRRAIRDAVYSPQHFQAFAAQRQWTFQANYQNDRDALLGESEGIKWTLTFNPKLALIIWETANIQSPGKVIFIGPRNVIDRMAKIKPSDYSKLPEDSFVPMTVCPVGIENFRERFGVLTNDCDLSQRVVTIDVQLQFLKWPPEFLEHGPVYSDGPVLSVGFDALSIHIDNLGNRLSSSLDWIDRVVTLGLVVSKAFRAANQTKT